jgi:ribosomal protein S18 acetylase RimI-like enzyme
MSDPLVPPGFVLGDTSAMSVAQLAEATNRTFTGYFVSIQHTTHSFARFCCAFQLDMALSVLLQTDPGELVGLAMLGIRDLRGWCGGFGIVPEYRGRGLAAHLIAGLITQARRAGLTTLQLEVLTQNTAAIRVYRNAGFEVTRDVLILAAEAPQVQAAIGPSHRRDEYRSELLTLEQALAVQNAVAMSPQPAYPWQRDLASLITGRKVQCRLATREGRPRALLIYRIVPSSGAISIDRCIFDEEAAAHALLGRAIEEAMAAHSAAEGTGLTLHVLNEPEGSPLLALLQPLGFRATNRQHEMKLELG